MCKFIKKVLIITCFFTIVLGATPKYNLLCFSYSSNNIPVNEIAALYDEVLQNKKSETEKLLDEKDTKEEPAPKQFIKWVDFNVDYKTLKAAYKSDLELKKLGIKNIGTCELLSYLALKNANNFNFNADNKRLKSLISKIKADNNFLDYYTNNKYYKYYVESMHAVLDSIIGYKDELKTDYGVIGYFPLKKGHWYTHYDDFGNKRNYGYKRRHLGHDLMGSTGTPIIAVEGGTITELGWNQYGGWRVGIRSNDGKRYHYYAHLRKDKPYAEGLKKGDTVKAGDLIGYLGVTGYSHKENTNMKTKPHLHYGMQLIFDESQLDRNEIWIDVYSICQFLS